MRHFLRHPSDLPVELVLRKQTRLPRQKLNDISLGGVACNSNRSFRRGTAIELRIPMFGKDACYAGLVAWSHKQADHYLVGICFVDEDTLFRARMVEQVCQIEHYRRLRERELGKSLCIESVAQEWIAEHAADFPCTSNQ